MDPPMYLQPPLLESLVFGSQKTVMLDETEGYSLADHLLPWSQQPWQNNSSMKELTEHCSLCKEIGHNHKRCHYPIFHVMVPGIDGAPDKVKAMVWKPPNGKTYRCGRCGRRGHNRRTCHGSVLYYQ